MPEGTFDAVVVGAGPNGLACAIELARADWSVLVIEGADTVGGGMRTAEVTRPGFRHDICAAIHPMGIASPFFRTIPLSEHGVEWLHPSAPLAHPLDDGSTAVLERSIDATAETLGPDGDAYRKLVAPLTDIVDEIVEQFLAPVRPPRHPFALARFVPSALRGVDGLARSRFAGEHARALLGGIGAHSMLRLDQVPTAAIALLFSAIGHKEGWPMVAGGTQVLADALAAYLVSLGGRVECGRTITSLDAVPPSRAVVFDVTPRQLLRIAGDQLPHRYRRRLGRFRYGPGVFKIDWALDGPIPWKADECSRAGTVHIGGTLDEMAAAETEVTKGEHPQRPYMLLSQQSLFDPTRAPAGKHTVWSYCHVPHGSTFDMTDRMEAQVERFAPGFRDLILDRDVRPPAAMEAYNPNYVGGDINGGLADIRQLITRPFPTWNPYSTPHPRLFLCSSSTPPGGGVHGMCGVFAARTVLRRRG